MDFLERNKKTPGSGFLLSGGLCLFLAAWVGFALPVPAVVSPYSSYLRIANDTCVFNADGTDVCTVSIKVRDLDYNPIANTQVTIYTGRGASDIITQPGLTDLNGMCTGTIVSSVTGSCTVMALTPEGDTIYENLIIGNPSFEEGAGADALYWTEGSANHGRYSDRAHSGLWSVRAAGLIADAAATRNDSNSQVYENSDYLLSAWFYDTSTAGQCFVDLGNATQRAYAVVGNDVWHKVTELWQNTSLTSVNARLVTTAGFDGTTWVDDIALRRYPTITFVGTASKLKIVTPVFNATSNNPSPYISVEAQDSIGNKDGNFNDTVILVTSSVGGKFSLDRINWSDTTIITLSSGSVYFYYKDANTGNPIITVERSGFSPDTQTETVLAQSMNTTASYIAFIPYEILADGSSLCTTVVTVNDTFGFAISGRTVLLTSTRAGSDVFTGNPGTTDANGQCTFTVSSLYYGSDTLVAVCDANTVTRGINKDSAVLILHFDTDTVDVSGSGCSVVNTGALWTSAPDSAAHGSALQFNGESNYSSVSNYGASDEISFSFWFKANRVGTGTGSDYSCAILTHADGTNGWWIEWRNNGSLELNTRVGGVPTGYTILGSFTDTANWYYLAGTITANGAVKVWVNTALRTDSTIGGWSDYNGNLLIGTGRIDTFNPSGYLQYFKGIIDEVKIYNRALSPDEIYADYAQRANLLFTSSSSFNFVTPPVTATAANPSSFIIAEALDGAGVRDVAFSNTATLSSSSVGGKFSPERVNWSDTTTITFFKGLASFYYKDANTGNPIITVERSGFSPDTQTETVLAQSMNTTASYIAFIPYEILADGSSLCTTVVTVNDTFGFAISGRTVLLTSTRAGSDVFTGNPGTTDANGQCTFTVTSSFAGADTLVALCDVNTITRGVNRYGAVAVFHFDTDTKDVSGNNNNGTLSSTGPLWVSSPDSAAHGSALHFDGVDDYIDCGNGTSLDITGAITIQGWIKYDSAVQNARADIINKHSGAADGYGIFKSVNNELSWLPGDGVSWNRLDSSITLIPNAWYHFACVSSTNARKIYINGIERGTGAGIASISSSSPNLLIGGIAESRTADYKGIIDEVKIYNRALSPDEIYADYAQRANLNFVYANPKHLKFITPAITATVNNPSAFMAIEVQDDTGDRDVSFNDTVVLASSSASGTFSLDRVNWTNITQVVLASGYGIFYYKDGVADNPVITISSSGISSDVQAEAIFAQSLNETASYITFSPYEITADGLSVCTAVVTVNDTYGFGVQGRNVTLVMARGAADTITPSGAQATDINGQCTFTIKSSTPGQDTITVTCDAKIVTRGVNKYGAAAVWHFDVDVKDVSGNANTTTINGALWTTAPDSSAHGSALKFDGNDYLDCGGGSSLDITGEITMEAWIKYDPAVQGIRADIVNKHEGAGNGYGFAKAIGDDIVWWTGNGASFQTLHGNTALQPNTWYHAAVVNCASYTKVYVNGQEDGTGAGLFPMVSSPLHPIIGGQAEGPAANFKGLIDEVKIYNRVLSPAEIKADYEQKAGIYFTLYVLEITTNAFAIKAGDISPQIKVVLKDVATGNTETSFSGTAVLATTSNSGAFSVLSSPWTDTSTITFSSGVATFYYKDNQVGLPVIGCATAGVVPDTQMEGITPKQFTFMTPPFTISTINTSPLIVVIAEDGLGNTATAATGETILLTTTSPRGRFSVLDNPWSDTSQPTLMLGSVSFYYTDRRGGNPTITVSRSELGLYSGQQETVVLPLISVTKTMLNIRTSASGTIVPSISGDTVEYTISVKNDGTETATDVTVTDTIVFDTTIYMPVVFLSMDETTDTFEYRTDIAGWTAGAPASGQENIKGLRWGVSALGINGQQDLKFRVRIK